MLKEQAEETICRMRRQSMCLRLGFASALVLVLLSWPHPGHAADLPQANSLGIGRYLKVALIPSSQQVDLFAGSGRGHVAYEIYVANFATTTVKLLAMHIDAAPGPRAFHRTIESEPLDRSFSSIAGDYIKAQRPIIKPAQTGVIFVLLDFDSVTNAPDSIINSVDVEAGGSSATAQRIRMPPLVVRRTGAVTVHAPLSGDSWLAANGPSNKSIHRRSIFVVDGEPRIGQRFAIDWVKLGPDGSTYHGDRAINADYYAYDAPVSAIADGRIISVTDGIPDNVPNSAKLAVELNLHNAGGNSIAEDLGAGRFAMYAHLRPGSIAIKPGDTVHAGQTLGRVGNTGSSSEPHLHLQVCDAPSFLASSGIPYEIDSFDVINYRIDQSHSAPVKLIIHGSNHVSDATPMQDELVSFGRPK